MASTYVNDLRLNELATGDGAGTWGTTTNTNLELIGEAFSFGTEAITTNADTHTTTIADGASDPGRSMYLKYTGTLDSACTITIGPNTVSKMWFIENATTGSQNIIISQGSGANITIPAGDTKAVYSDGAGSGAAFVDAFASLSVVDLKVQDDLTVTDDASVGGDLTVTGSIIGTLTTAAQTNITSVGALDGGSITSGFGSIDVGSSAITTTGTVTGNTLAGTLSTAAQPNITSLGTLTGLDVAGTPTFDGLTVDGTSNFNGTINAKNVIYLKEPTSGTANGALFIADTQEVGIQAFGASGHITFDTGSSVVERMRIASNGDISFYDDTGVSQALFWDASAERLGIGTTSPSAPLHVGGEAYFDAGTRHYTYDDQANFWSLYTNTDDSFRFNYNGSGGDEIVIDTSGNVGIGTPSPTAKLHIAGDSGIRVNNSASTQQFDLKAQGSNLGIENFFGSGSTITFGTNANGGGVTEAMRIDSSGNVGIGTSSPAYSLDVQSSATTGIVAMFSNDANQTSEEALIWIAGQNKTNYGVMLGAVPEVDTPGVQDHAFIVKTNDSTGTDHTERFRISSDGNVGIGTDSPTSKLQIMGGTSGVDQISLSSNLTDNTIKYAGLVMTMYTNNTAALIGAKAENGNTSLYYGSSGTDHRGVTNHIWYTNTNYNSTSGNTERMRIDTSGNLYIGTTSEATGSTGGVTFSADSSNRRNLICATTSTGTLELLEFRNPNGTVGTITTSGSATAYNTSSDARLKDITGSARGLEVINELNPVSYNWKADGKADEGLIAQEVLDIVPNAVSGSEEDMYQMDYSKLIVHLVKGMKEQQTQIEALQSEINLLKGE
jgi:hypothetical protein